MWCMAWLVGCWRGGLFLAVLVFVSEKGGNGDVVAAVLVPVLVDVDVVDSMKAPAQEL